MSKEHGAGDPGSGLSAIYQTGYAGANRIVGVANAHRSAVLNSSARTNDFFVPDGAAFDSFSNLSVGDTGNNRTLSELSE